MNWINVKDKLPETSKGIAQPEFTSGDVLVFCKDGSYNIATCESWDEGKTYEWYTDGEGLDITKYVTHWTPLPEPPC